ETTAPEAAPGCDEVACVISKYDRPCCDRFKPASSDITKRTGNTPDELDRAAVRAGMEKAKPAVVQCGEKSSTKGTVKIAVTVAPEGNVTGAEVTLPSGATVTAIFTVPFVLDFSPHWTTAGFAFSMPARTAARSSSSGVLPVRFVISELAGLNRSQHGRSYFEITHATSSHPGAASGAVVS